MLPWSGGSVCRLFSINSSCAWNWTVRRGSLLSTTSSPFLVVLEFRDVEESEGECRLIPGPYTDILGCSIRRSSIGLASKTSGESPLASKQGGGVTYQLSSSWIWAFNLGSSFSFSSVENKSERWFWGNANLAITEKEIWCHHIVAQPNLALSWRTHLDFKTITGKVKCVKMYSLKYKICWRNGCIFRPFSLWITFQRHNLGIEVSTHHIFCLFERPLKSSRHRRFGCRRPIPGQVARLFRPKCNLKSRSTSWVNFFDQQ